MGSHGGSDAVVGRGGRPDTWVTDSARAPRGPAALRPELEAASALHPRRGGIHQAEAITNSRSIAAAATPWAVGERAARSATGPLADGDPLLGRFALHRLATSKADPAGALLAFA